MKQINSAATYAGARSPRARTPEAPAFPPVARRALLPAVRAIRRDLGLSTGDLLVLDALLSFLPCRDPKTGEDRPISPGMMLVIFASNAALAERANGMDERVLRRHLSRLCEAGLLQRKDSATGKRFPLKAGGVIRDAFGLDLTPLLEQHTELLRRAAEARQKEEALRSARAEALALRVRVLAMRDRIGEEAVGYLETVKTILRRATITIDQVRDLMGRMAAILTGAPCPASPRESTAGDVPSNSTSTKAPQAAPGQEWPSDPTPERPVQPTLSREARPTRSPSTRDDPCRDMRPRPAVGTTEMSAGDGQDVRRVESPKIDEKNTRMRLGTTDPWLGCREIASFYPAPPRSETELIRIIHDFGRMMNIPDRPLAAGLGRIGVIRMLQALDYLARHISRITRPEAYLDRMITDYEAGKPVGWAR